MLKCKSVCAYQRNNLCGLCHEFVRQIFIELDEMPNVNITVVLFLENILADLISVLESVLDFRALQRYLPVYEGVLEAVLKNKLL